MGKELQKLNMVHLHHWSSPQPKVWEKNAADTLTDQLSAELISTKKVESYAKTISWIRAKNSLSLKIHLLCLRGSRTIKKISCDIKNIDIVTQTTESAMSIETQTSILLYVPFLKKIVFVNIDFQTIYCSQVFERLNSKQLLFMLKILSVNSYFSLALQVRRS